MTGDDEVDGPRVVEVRGWDGSWFQPQRMMPVDPRPSVLVVRESGGDDRAALLDVRRQGKLLVGTGATLYGDDLPAEGVGVAEVQFERPEATPLMVLEGVRFEASPTLIGELARTIEDPGPAPILGSWAENVAQRFKAYGAISRDQLDVMPIGADGSPLLRSMRAVDDMLAVEYLRPVLQVTLSATISAPWHPQPHKQTRRAKRRARGRFKAWVREMQRDLF